MKRKAPVGDAGNDRLANSIAGETMRPFQAASLFTDRLFKNQSGNLNINPWSNQGLSL
jgi:hypothetical protein